jgi:cholesterol transport system auxiliary component
MRLAIVAIAGCALTSKSPPLDVRYYTPTDVDTTVVERSAPASSVKIRLDRVSASSHLRSRIAYRASPTELELYETRRWTEPPEAFVRRSLEHELVERGVLVTGGKALELDVEVVAFEERGAPPTAHVRLRYMLIDDRVVIADGIVAVEQPAEGDFASFVAAIGKALDKASAKLVAEVVAR